MIISFTGVKIYSNFLLVKQFRIFINELTIWLDHYNRSTPFKSIAIKVFMTLPCLLLQKTSRNSKAKDHSKALEDRLKLWNEGKIDMLVKEARTIQNRFRNSTNTKRTQNNSARSFAKLIWESKTQASLKMLSIDYENCVLKIDDDILAELKSKHPHAA